MKAMSRSLSGATLMLIIIPAIVGLLACMPVPVGDPERSRIDPELSGAWSMIEDDASIGTYLFRPYDKRTWLVLGIDEEDGQLGKVAIYKAWLKKLGGEQFMTWEQAGGIDKDGSFAPEYWLVFRVEKLEGNQIKLHMLDYEFEGFEGIPGPQAYEGDYVRDMRKRFERVIRQHADDADMYGEALLLGRLNAEELEKASALFNEAIELE